MDEILRLLNEANKLLALKKESSAPGEEARRVAVAHTYLQTAILWLTIESTREESTQGETIY